VTGRAEEFAARLRERIHEVQVEAGHELGSDVLAAAREVLPAVLRLLRDDFGFDMLMDLSCTDWHPRQPRFDVNYHLYGLDTNHRVRVKVQVGADDPRVPSAVEIWPTADWHEREVFDFFGIVFTGHPDLRRIFMPEEWIGHPLRKDYPVGGVPVEYKIEPAYVGPNVPRREGLPAFGGVPARLRRDRGRPSHWTWSGPPATGVRVPDEPEPPEDEPAGDGEEA
jgi:NADH-quinone oxidoreductase subunit C